MPPKFYRPSQWICWLKLLTKVRTINLCAEQWECIREQLMTTSGSASPKRRWKFTREEGTNTQGCVIYRFELKFPFHGNTRKFQQIAETRNQDWRFLSRASMSMINVLSYDSGRRAMPKPISLSLARMRRPLHKSLAAKLLIFILVTNEGQLQAMVDHREEKTKDLEEKPPFHPWRWSPPICAHLQEIYAATEELMNITL